MSLHILVVPMCMHFMAGFDITITIIIPLLGQTYRLWGWKNSMWYTFNHGDGVILLLHLPCCPGKWRVSA